METIVLVIHLILALTIIGLVLIQRSSGGGLGIGGGGGMGDFASARSTASALTKMTTYFAFAFFATSLTLAWMAGNHGKTGVLDAVEDAQTQIEVPVNVPVDTKPAEPEVPTGK